MIGLKYNDEIYLFVISLSISIFPLTWTTTIGQIQGLGGVSLLSNILNTRRIFNHNSPLIATQRLKDIFCDNPSKLYLEVPPPTPPPTKSPHIRAGRNGRYKNQSRVVWISSVLHSWLCNLYYAGELCQIHRHIILQMLLHLTTYYVWLSPEKVNKNKTSCYIPSIYGKWLLWYTYHTIDLGSFLDLCDKQTWECLNVNFKYCLFVVDGWVERSPPEKMSEIQTLPLSN